MLIMNKVQYKGESYDYKTIVQPSGSREYLLYKNDILMHVVSEDELEKKPLICILRSLADKHVHQAV